MKLDIGFSLQHKFQPTISVVLLEPTRIGWKVRQTELTTGWSDRKLSTPKVKQVFYTNNDLHLLFNPI